MKATASRSVREAALASELLSRRSATHVWIVDRGGGCIVGQLESATRVAIRLKDKSGVVRTIPNNSTARVGWRKGNPYAGALVAAAACWAAVPLGFATAVGADRDALGLAVIGGGIAGGVLLGKKISGRREVWVIERNGG